MSRVNGTSKNDTDKLFEVIWVERVSVLAKIWAESPEEAIEKAKEGDLENFVKPFGTFLDSDLDSYVCDGEIVGASKKDYICDSNPRIEINY